jgi:SHS2 domain-containing protein
MSGKSWRFLEGVTMADVAIEARGDTLDELFASAGEAVLGTMVDDTEAVRAAEHRELLLASETEEELLHEFLQKIVFYKDAERLVLKPSLVKVEQFKGLWRLEGVLTGEKIDSNRHALATDVKAVTWHQFAIEKGEDGYRALFVLDT